jgi:hypothetical protein
VWRCGHFGGLDHDIRKVRFAALDGHLSLAGHVQFVPILLQQSKIEPPQKSRESRSLDVSATVSLVGAATEVRDRFRLKRYGPSRRLASSASAALRIFIRHPKKTFATISAISGHPPALLCDEHCAKTNQIHIVTFLAIRYGRPLTRGLRYRGEIRHD